MQNCLEMLKTLLDHWKDVASCEEVNSASRFKRCSSRITQSAMTQSIVFDVNSSLSGVVSKG